MRRQRLEAAITIAAGQVLTMHNDLPARLRKIFLSDRRQHDAAAESERRFTTIGNS